MKETIFMILWSAQCGPWTALTLIPVRSNSEIKKCYFLAFKFQISQRVGLTRDLGQSREKNYHKRRGKWKCFPSLLTPAPTLTLTLILTVPCPTTHNNCLRYPVSHQTQILTLTLTLTLTLIHSSTNSHPYSHLLHWPRPFLAITLSINLTLTLTRTLTQSWSWLLSLLSLSPWP